MFQWLESFSPIAQAMIATGFTWLVTALGAAVVFVTWRVHRRVLDSMLGFAGGVMIAASFWSLLAPAIEVAGPSYGTWAWVPAASGFLAGAGALLVLDKLLPHLHPSLRGGEPEGPHTTIRRQWLLVLAITIHNIPEGLAVGIAFGGAGETVLAGSVAAAAALALGIGIQNFPEGIAVAMPLRGQGMSMTRAFLFGQASGVVEPMAGLAGVLLVTQLTAILPYAYAFAAGAMIYVVVEELIPESHSAGNTDLATISLIVGFTVMMSLDVALG
jgi:ZIP family zinc transporter